MEPIIPYDDLPESHADWFADEPHARAAGPSLLDRYSGDHLLNEMRDLIGDYRTLAFWAWADRDGKRPGRSWRRQVYISSQDRLREKHPLVAVIGKEAARLVCARFGGATYDLPNGGWVIRRQARRYVHELARQGHSPDEIAKIMSEDYPRRVSVRWVRYVLEDPEP